MGGRSGEDLSPSLPQSTVTHTNFFFYKFTCHLESVHSAWGSGVWALWTPTGVGLPPSFHAQVFPSQPDRKDTHRGRQPRWCLCFRGVQEGSPEISPV